MPDPASPSPCFGLVTNSTASGTPASSRRGLSSHQTCGRYNARSINARPQDVDNARKTPTWQFSIRPVAGRCTAVARRRTFFLFRKLRLINDQYARILIRHQMRRRVTHQFIPHLLGVPTGSAQQLLNAVGLFVLDAQLIANCSSAPLLRAILGRIPPPADAGHA